MDTRRLCDSAFRRRKQRYAIRAHRLHCIVRCDHGWQRSNRRDWRRTRVRRVTRSTTAAVEGLALVSRLRYVRGRRAGTARHRNSGGAGRSAGSLHATTRHHAGACAEQGAQHWLER
jgi:hypothetical protein